MDSKEYQMKTLLDIAAESFLDKVRQRGEDYDHRGSCADTARKIHIRKLAREATEEARILIEEIINYNKA